MEYQSSIEWLHRRGYHVIKTQSSYWYDIGLKVYQAFPYHILITPSNDEISNFFRQSAAIAIRYSTPLNQPVGQLSYHVIYDRDEYNVDKLSKKARHDINKGFHYASYEPIPMKRLAKEGWSIREETLIRQGRKHSESRNFWEALCSSADGLPGFEAWGALHEGSLVAALFACSIDETVSIYYQQSLTHNLKYCVNNALTYVFTHEVLNRPGIRCIFYGLHSLDAPSSVDKFKFRMGYSPKSIRQRVVFNPLIRPLIQPLSHLLLKTLLKIIPANTQISKVEGMVRFYLHGKRPLAEQEWPDALQDQREMIFDLAG